MKGAADPYVGTGKMDERPYPAIPFYLLKARSIDHKGTSTMPTSHEWINVMYNSQLDIAQKASE